MRSDEPVCVGGGEAVAYSCSAADKTSNLCRDFVDQVDTSGTEAGGGPERAQDSDDEQLMRYSERVPVDAATGSRCDVDES
eukprot:3880191-Rhodomonas_salina.1